MHFCLVGLETVAIGHNDADNRPATRDGRYYHEIFCRAVLKAFVCVAQVMRPWISGRFNGVIELAGIWGCCCCCCRGRVLLISAFLTNTRGNVRRLSSTRNYGYALSLLARFLCSVHRERPTLTPSPRLCNFLVPFSGACFTLDLPRSGVLAYGERDRRASFSSTLWIVDTSTNLLFAPALKFVFRYYFRNYSECLDHFLQQYLVLQH